MRTAVFKIFTLLFLAVEASGQSVADTVRLHDVTIVETQREPNQTVDEEVLPLYRGNNLAGLLTSNGANIRQYSPGGVATIAPRGYTPQQVSVKWNGVDITNPMLAQTDLSLLPVFFVDAAEMQTQPTALDNAPAGSVNLQERFVNSRFNASLFNAWSSLQNVTNAFQIKTGGKKLFTSAKLLREQNQNAFNYRNVFYNDSTMQVKHGSSDGKGGSVGVKYIADKNVLHAGGFVYELDRLIPPTMLQQEGLDEQSDHTSAAFVHYQHCSKTTIIADASAVFHEIGFYDGTIEQRYNSNASVYRSSLNLSRRNALVDVTAEMQTALFSATVLPDVYKRSEWQHAAKLGLSKEIKTLRSKINVEGIQRLRETDVLPFNYVIALSANPFSTFNVRLEHCRTGRLPGLNDRYWKPGGNSDLKAEDAKHFGADASYRLNVFSKTSASISCDAYYDRVENWIQWIPIGGLWSPRNIKSVLLSGLTPALSVERKTADSRVALTLRYNFNRAVTRSSFTPADASVGKQLMYVPLQTFGAHLVANFKRWSSFVLFNGYDARYIQSDNTDWLEPYATLDIAVSYVIPLNKISFNATAKVQNATGSEYQSLAWRPMPRQVFSFSLDIQYHPSNKAK